MSADQYSKFAGDIKSVLNPQFNDNMGMITIVCDDGFVLKGEFFSAQTNDRQGKTVIINSATAVSRKFYKNYAIHLAQNGFDTLIYDYRGIADSRPQKLRGFKTSFTCWGQKDFSAVINYAKKELPDNKILVVGHSIGGTLIGMSKVCGSIQGIITIGAQTSYYKDWGSQRYGRYLLWHVVFPIVTKIFGYFPGKKLKLSEDIPKGVIKQWNQRKKHPHMVAQLEKTGHKVFYDRYKGRLLTLAIEDDGIGTTKAVKRVHELFISANKEFKCIVPRNVGVDKIGHFGFFSRKFKHTLWQKSVDWYKKI